MKKVKATIILVAIRLVMILNEMFQTKGSLKAFRISDEKTNPDPQDMAVASQDYLYV